MKKLRALIIEDNDNDAELLLRHLRGSYEVEHIRVETAEATLAALEDESLDVILSDYSMPRFSGLKAIELVKKLNLNIPLIIISGTIGEETAVKAMLAGASDYFVKGNLGRLVPAIERELEEARNRRAKHEAELRLQQSEQDYRALIEASSLFVWTADYDFSSGELFKWFSELSGREINNIPDIAGIMHPEDVPECKRNWSEAIKETKIFDMVCRFLTKSGEYCYLAVRSVPIFNQDGTFRKWVGTFNDITERMLAEKGLRENEQALRKSEAQFRLIAETVPTLISYLDTSHRCIFVNDKYLDWFGCTRDECVGRHVREILGADVYEHIRPEYDRVLSGGAFSIERPTFHDNGASFMRISYVPDFKSEGEMRGFFVFMIDLTESKRAEERLRRSEEQLRQAQKLESIGRLAGGIAHDFNNMLTAINGYSELTLLRLPTDHPARKNIEEIKKAGERSAALTQQLLAFSRRQILEVQTLSLNQIIEDSIVMMQRLIGEDIRIVEKLDDKAFSVSGDSSQLTQVLLNLVVNARDAMPNGGTITIFTQNIYLDSKFVARRPGSREGQFVRLTVADTGIGMDEETQRHIFEPFFTTKETGKGTGLGLSMVYGIVKQLNGYVWVTSYPDGGTTFDIYLPKASTGAKSESNEQVAPAPRGDGTILLVEDEEIVRELSRQVLEFYGYRVINAESAATAIEIFKERGSEIDMLMTDVVMPGMGGQELAEALKTTRPELKVLFTSGYLEEPVTGIEKNGENGNFIQKPFAYDQLARKVKNLLE